MPMSAKAARKHPDGIWIINAEGKTVYANQAMTDMLRTTPADIVGQDSFDFIFPEDLPAAQRLFEQKQAGGSAPFQFTLRRKDGTPLRVEVQGTPMHNAAGDFLGVVGTFTQSDAEAR